MNFQEIIDNKNQYLDLLLLGDEQEEMINHYLNSGRMFILFDKIVKAAFVFAEIDSSTIELKNIAVYPKYQKKGYGRKCLEFIEQMYQGTNKTLIVGTGEVPSTMGFYKHCGFEYSHRIRNFFIDNYDHIIIENGRVLQDMVYLSKKL